MSASGATRNPRPGRPLEARKAFEDLVKTTEQLYPELERRQRAGTVDGSLLARLKDARDSFDNKDFSEYNELQAIQLDAHIKVVERLLCGTRTGVFSVATSSSHGTAAHSQSAHSAAPHNRKRVSSSSQLAPKRLRVRYDETPPLGELSQSTASTSKGFKGKEESRRTRSDGNVLSLKTKDAPLGAKKVEIIVLDFSDEEDAVDVPAAPTGDSKSGLVRNQEKALALPERPSGSSARKDAENDSSRAWWDPDWEDTDWEAQLGARFKSPAEIMGLDVANGESFPVPCEPCKRFERGSCVRDGNAGHGPRCTFCVQGGIQACLRGWAADMAGDYCRARNLPWADSRPSANATRAPGPDPRVSATDVPAPEPRKHGPATTGKAIDAREGKVSGSSSPARGAFQDRARTLFEVCAAAQGLQPATLEELEVVRTLIDKTGDTPAPLVGVLLEMEKENGVRLAAIERERGEARSELERLDMFCERMRLKVGRLDVGAERERRLHEFYVDMGRQLQRMED